MFAWPSRPAARYNVPMLYHAIDSALVACPSLDDAVAAHARLGLTVGAVSAGQRVLRLDDFALYLLADTGPPLADPLAAALAAGRGLFAVALRVTDLPATVRILRGRGVPIQETTAVAWLPVAAQAGTDLLLVAQDEPVPPPAHRFPLLRLDHLAAIPGDLDGNCRFWEEVLGVPVAGEVVTPSLVIRQLRIGDAVLELLGPASPDSPLRQRPTGLVSMMSCEVADLDAAVAQARAAGFTVADPAPGPLPNTRIATLPGTELAGVNLQLLQRVPPG